MQTILKPSERTLKILGSPKTKKNGMRWMQYVISKQVDDGMLLFHVLTRELLLLSLDEYNNPDGLPQLEKKWFRVPCEIKDREYADAVRMVLESMKKKSEYITGYTIFTTTDCNARCFYCYELGRSRIPMSEETAHKVASYIEAHCGKKPVKLSWFGGEPLYNKKVINIICSDLKEKDIQFYSSMITNGYLFNEETIKSAVSLWNLKGVQITLDGTEDVYNQCKAYIYKDESSPYQIVMNNIENILKAGIKVTIRLNVDNHNADNLLELIEQLHSRFKGQKQLKVYSRVLFEFTGKYSKERSSRERRDIYEKDKLIKKKIEDCGFKMIHKLRKEIPLNQCMADNDSSITVLPDGNLGKCEHYSENNFVGHIEAEKLNETVIKEFKERHMRQKECDSCIFYPECIRIKKCEEAIYCSFERRKTERQSLVDSMKETYRKWLQKENVPNNIQKVYKS